MRPWTQGSQNHIVLTFEWRRLSSCQYLYRNERNCEEIGVQAFNSSLSSGVLIRLMRFMCTRTVWVNNDGRWNKRSYLDAGLVSKREMESVSVFVVKGGSSNLSIQMTLGRENSLDPNWADVWFNQCHWKQWKKLYFPGIRVHNEWVIGYVWAFLLPLLVIRLKSSHS
jgi:hypothetical protein